VKVTIVGTPAGYHARIDGTRALLCLEGLREVFGYIKLPMVVELSLTPIDDGLEVTPKSCACCFVANGVPFSLSGQQRSILRNLLDIPISDQIPRFWMKVENL
jgi:hypothetical protein